MECLLKLRRMAERDRSKALLAPSQEIGSSALPSKRRSNEAETAIEPRPTKLVLPEDPSPGDRPIAGLHEPHVRRWNAVRQMCKDMRHVLDRFVVLRSIDPIARVHDRNYRRKAAHSSKRPEPDPGNPDSVMDCRTVFHRSSPRRSRGTLHVRGRPERRRETPCRYALHSSRSLRTSPRRSSPTTHADLALSPQLSALIGTPPVAGYLEESGSRQMSLPPPWGQS